MRSNDDIRLVLPKPNGSTLAFEYVLGGIHVHIEDRHGGGMGINMTGEEVKRLEAFLLQRRILIDG